MTKLSLLLAGAVAATATPSGALAGYHQTVEVTFYSNFTYGSVSDVRRSADNVQYIQCVDYGSYGVCRARDKSGVSRACTTYDATLRALMGNINDTSLIRFQYALSGSTCALVEVTNSSIYLD